MRVIYRIYRLEPLEPDDACAIGDGCCQHRSGRIRLNPELAPEALFECLLHEIAHAIHEVADLVDGASEEDYATRTTPLWLCVWRDNPALLQMLTRYSTIGLDGLSELRLL